MHKILLLLALLSILSSCSKSITGVLVIHFDDREESVPLMENSYKNENGNLFGSLESLDANQKRLYKLDWFKKDKNIQIILLDQKNQKHEFLIKEGTSKQLINIENLKLDYKGSREA